MMVSLCAVLLPVRVLDEIWDLIQSVSEGFPTYFLLHYLRSFSTIVVFLSVG